MSELKALCFFILIFFAHAASPCVGPTCAGCKTLDDSNRCIQCFSNYLLVSQTGRCLLISGQSQQQSNNVYQTSFSSSSNTVSSSPNNFGTATYIDLNCKIPNPNGGCSQCVDRYYFDRTTNLCQKVSPLCQEWNSLGVCVNCFEGYILTAENGCLKKVTVTAGSKLITSITFLDQTSNSNYNRQAASTTSSQSGSSGIKSGSTTSQTSTSSTTTTSSQQNRSTGSISSSGSGGVTYNIPNCARFGDKGECIQCSFRYVKINPYNCKQVSDRCKEWFEQSGACRLCYDGFELSGSDCVVKKISSIAQQAQGQLIMVDNCAEMNQDRLTCRRCIFRYVPFNGGCKKVSDYCKSWLMTSGACSQCYDGYNLVKTECIVGNNQQKPTQPSVQIEGCSKYNSDMKTCALCIFRYVLSNGICKKVSDQCKTWYYLSGQCTECYDGYKIQNKACVLNQTQPPTQDQYVGILNCAELSQDKKFCRRCSFRYVSWNGGCKKVSDQCKAWDQNNGGCTDCYDGYIVSGNDCILKPNTGLSVSSSSSSQSRSQSLTRAEIPFCSEYSVDGQSCIRCSFRSVLWNNICKKVSDQCRAWDPNNGGCTDCYVGYSLVGAECIISSTPSPSVSTSSSSSSTSSSSSSNPPLPSSITSTTTSTSTSFGSNPAITTSGFGSSSSDNYEYSFTTQQSFDTTNIPFWDMGSLGSF